MTITQKQVLAWAREVWGDDSGKPWSEQSINHLTAFAAVIERAVRADRKWRGLTDEEVGTLTVFPGLFHVETPLLAEYIRHIEAKLREKNA